MVTNEVEKQLRAALARFEEARTELLRFARGPAAMNAIYNTRFSAIWREWQSAALDALSNVATLADVGSPLAMAATQLRAALSRNWEPWAIGDVLGGRTPASRDALRALAAAERNQHAPDKLELHGTRNGAVVTLDAADSGAKDRGAEQRQPPVSPAPPALWKRTRERAERIAKLRNLQSDPNWRAKGRKEQAGDLGVEARTLREYLAEIGDK